MKTITVILIIKFLTAGSVLAGWSLSGVFGANYSGTALSSNWAGSESEARNWIIQGDMKAVLDSSPSQLSNSLKTEYGRSYYQDASETVTADLIYLESLYTYSLSRYGNPYLSFSADTGFTDFFNPGVLTESAGLSWILMQNGSYSLKTRLGGALRQTIIKGAESDTDTGMQSVTSYSLTLAENLKFSSEMNIFTAFEGGADMRWDNSLYIKLGRYLTASIGYLAVYDYDSSAYTPAFPDEIQSRLTFGIGVSYNIF